MSSGTSDTILDTLENTLRQRFYAVVQCEDFHGGALKAGVTEATTAQDILHHVLAHPSVKGFERKLYTETLESFAVLSRPESTKRAETAIEIARKLRLYCKKAFPAEGEPQQTQKSNDSEAEHAEDHCEEHDLEDCQG